MRGVLNCRPWCGSVSRSRSGLSRCTLSACRCSGGCRDQLGACSGGRDRMFEVVTAVLGTVWLVRVLSTAVSLEGPRFSEEPPSHVIFVNTKGAEVRCTATGSPAPTVRWVFQDGRAVAGVAQLLDVRPDGTLIFHPFRQEDFRPELHDTVYRCTAANVVGGIGSREVRIKAAIRQEYETHVYDQYAIRGTTAVLRCILPPGFRDYITVTSWAADNNNTVAVVDRGKGPVDSWQDEKYLAFSTGELYVHQVASQDEQRKFHCRTVQRLTGEETFSKTGGRLVVTDPQGGMPPKIVNSRPKVWASRGEVVLLPCAAQGQPPPAYRWVKKEPAEKPVPVKGHHVYQVQGTLRISGVMAEDSGRYVCIVNNSYGEDSSETDLIVTAPLQVTMEPHHLVVLTGESATLTCSLTGHPIDSILWMKDLRHLAEDGRVQFLAPNVLHLPVVWKQDHGMYQCFVYSAGRTEQAVGQLTVADVGPVLHDTFSETTVAPGTPVVLQCTASGHPLPEITWTVDGLPLPRNGRVVLGQFLTSHGRIVSSVNISHSSSQDGGSYECLAQNSVGSAAHSARLNVFGPPSIRPMNNVSVIEGHTLVLHCPVSGYPLETITWEKGGLQLPENPRQRVFPNGTLLVYDVQRDYDYGRYQCTARNREGQSDQQQVIVGVTTPPKIVPFESPRARAGTAVVFTCVVNQGDPPFHLRWLKNGQPLVRDAEVTMQIHDMFALLAFSEVRPHHAGNYTCLVTNAGGATSHSAQLVVDVPPTWVVEPRNASVTVGQSLVVDCKAEGVPPPTVTWKKASGNSPRDFEPLYNSYNFLVYGNGSLAIREANASSNGYYLCQASNSVGASLTKLIQVIVHAPPQFDTHHQVKTARIGAPLELVCAARGDQPLHATWSKDSTKIPDQGDERYTVSQKTEEGFVQSSLIVKEAERNDSGLLICRVENAYGVSEGTFQVVVQEAPGAPSGVKVVGKSGRSVTISWEEPFNGHSAITNYIVHYSSKKEGKWKNITVPAAKSRSSVRGLTPSTDYNVRLQAENAIGLSDYSATVSSVTEEEAPGGPPVNVRVAATGPNSIKVTWESPKRDVWNGRLKGYYIGYKVMGSSDPTMFKTLEIGKGRELEVHLTNLRRSTKYAVSVQAFNAQGTGPSSDQVVVQTLADVPPTAPILHVTSSSSSSITLSWSHKRTFGSPVTECTLFHRREYDEWQESTVPSQSNTHTVGELDCGSRYHFYMVCHNSVGRSEPSEVLIARTTGAAPLSPPKEDFIGSDATTATLQLTSWQNGGCPIARFIIKLRKKYHSHWTTIAGHLTMGQPRHTVQGLTPGTWYELQVTAHSSAGATEAQYEFQTLNITEEVKMPQPSEAEPTLPFYLDIPVIVPATTSAVIVIIIVIVGCVLCHRRTSQRSGSSDGSGSSHSKARHAMESVALKDITGSGPQPIPIFGGLSSDDGTQRSSSSTSHSRPVSSLVPAVGKHDACYMQCPMKTTRPTPTLPLMTPFPTTVNWEEPATPDFAR